MRNETEDIPENGNPYMRHYTKQEREEARENLEKIKSKKKQKGK